MSAGSVFWAVRSAQTERFLWWTGPLASNEGQTWTNRQMIDYLRGRGLEFDFTVIHESMIPPKDLPFEDRKRLKADSLVILYPKGETLETAVIHQLHKRTKFLLSNPSPGKQLDPWTRLESDVRNPSKFHDVFRGSGVVFFAHHKDEEGAKEQMKLATEEMLVDPSFLFSWGRFVFAGDPDKIQEIRRALQ